TSCDLCLPRPLAFLAVDRMERRAVHRETRIALEINGFARTAAGSELKIGLGELDLDARDARRTVGAQGCDRLVPTGVEELPHPVRKLGFGRLKFLPRDHERST